MKIETIVGNDLNAVSKAVISQIEISSSLELENFVVVPDRFSLLAEKQIFEILGISSTFNIKVVGISRLASFFVEKKETISADESRLIIFEILSKGDFKFFAPKFETATEIYKIISQLKSSNVLMKEFFENCKTEKQKEIAKIFSFYEEQKQALDQSDILTNLVENLDKEKVKNCSFFFAGFDSLTAQGEKILEQLVLFSKRVVVGSLCPNNQKNSNVYDTDILNKIKRISKIHKIEIQKTYLKNEDEANLSGQIVNNLFSFSPNKFETKNVHLLEEETPEKEIKEIAKTILFYVKNKEKKFSSFNILSGNLEETSLIFERVFDEYKIPYFIDDSQLIQTLPIFSFYKNLFLFLTEDDEKNLFNLFYNPYSEISCEEISSLKNEILLKGFSIELAIKYENISKFVEKINVIKEKLEKLKTYVDFSNLILEINKEFSIEEKNNKLVEKFSNFDLKNEKIYVQIFKKLEGVLASLQLKSEVIAKTYFETFLLLFGEKKISSVPLSVDCVFVGNEKSFFEKKDVMFVCGANAGSVPQISKDVGLFSDDDIESVGLDIQPTIRMINKRNKQKLLFDLSLCNELFVLCSGSELGEKFEKSILFGELQKMFLFNGKPLGVFNSFYTQFLPQKDFALFQIQSEKDFQETILNLERKNKISKEEAKTYLKNKFFQEEKIGCSNELFERFSPTEIEIFFSCPFKHFFTHGLKLKENPKNVFDGRDNGNFFHLSAENFVKRNLKNLGNLTDFEIQSELEKICEIIEKEPRFEVLKKNIENRHIFEVLKKETKMLFQSINYEQKYSNFVAKVFEQGFSYNLKGKKLVGFVDRVDFAENFLRVVDYKSGETKKSLRAVYSGIELQLFIYLIVMHEKFGENVAGAVYLPISSDFSKSKEVKFRFEGFVLNNQGVIKDFDRRFGTQHESNIIALKLKPSSTPDNIVLSTTKNVLSKEGFDSIIEYVKQLLLSAEQEILSGKIDAKPVEENTCKNCKFFAICSFKQDQREEERKLGNEMSEKDFIRIIKKNE